MAKKRKKTDEDYGPAMLMMKSSRKVAGPNPNNTVNLSGRREAVSGPQLTMTMKSSKKRVPKTESLAGLKYTEEKRKDR